VLVADSCEIAIRSFIVANKEHIQPLMAALASQSMKSWNQWRLENPSVRPDLSGVELADANLSFANLSYADIRHANLSRTNLHHANLRHADLIETDLSGSILDGADLSGASLRDAKLRKANLIGANLDNANLKGADLEGVLIDTECVEGKKIGFGGGVSYLEKIALGLFARWKGKDHLHVKRETKPHRSDKHI
jgi:hypothetical protein